MRLSASAARRGINVAFATAIVSAGVTMTAPAAQAATAQIERVGYECQATDTLINSTLEKNYQYYVTAETNLPDKVEPGTQVPATSTSLDLTLSTSLVNQLYNKMGVTRVWGTSTSDVFLQAVAPGGEVITELSKPVKGLKADKPANENVVPGAEVTIPAQGTVDAIDVPDAPDGNGLIYVQMPKTFMLDSRVDPPVLGGVSEVELKCVRQDDSAAARVIGTIPIGAGCDESECPLPAAAGGGGGGNGGGNGGGGTGDGGGTGTDPDVIDPGAPAEETPIEEYDPEVSDGSLSDDGDVSSETTELPATGSALGLGLAGLLAALATLRVGIAVRSRRGNA